jgi:putative tricarboxylic transport membrane protein
MSRRNRFSAVALVVFSLAVGLKASTFPLGDLKSIGPGFFPLVLAALLEFLSLGLLFSSLTGREEKDPPKWPDRWAGIVIVLAALFAYGFLLKSLGFSLSTFLFSLALLKYGYPREWLIPLGGALATTVFTLVIFKYWLGTPFPAGWVGF